MFSLHLEFVSN